MTHRLLSHFRATGMTTPTGGTLAEPLSRVGPATERVRRTAHLVEEGVLLPIEVGGLRGTRNIVAAAGPTLATTADPSSIGEPTEPLDPLLWGRRFLRELWAFEYQWEVYVPKAKRHLGYYVLPILFGDRFVGRIEPRLGRRTPTLAILGI